MDSLLTSLAFYLFSLNLQAISEKQVSCGFPGTPAYGYVKPDKAAYFQSEVVYYSCRVGYMLLGSNFSKCIDDGSWSEEVPLCEGSMTTQAVAFSTPTMPGKPAELAIDRDKAACTYLKPMVHRWWRVDLGNEYEVLSVGITMISPDKYMKFTVYIIKTEGKSSFYKRCASFTGKFGTETVVLSCGEGKGIKGEKVHIEDHLPEEGIFEVCEVEVQVKKDTGYDCGRPSRSLYSIAYERKNNMVDYGCIRGYEIKGSDYRYCLKTGQWSGDPPTCEPILCDDLGDFENGKIQITPENGSPPLEGAIAMYKCNRAFRIDGPTTRNCLKDGSWSGRNPKCKAIRCPLPDGKDNTEFYRLLNKTTSMGSVAMLKCNVGRREGDNPYIICTEDGTWTSPDAYCLLHAKAAYESLQTPRIENQGVIIFGMVVAAVMIVVVLVAMYLYGQKRNSNKPELPSRSIEPPVPPPRPPPRTNKGAAFKSAFIGFMNRENSGNQGEPKAAWKTQSLPTNNANGSDTADNYNPKRALSYGETLDEPAVIQVEVLAHDDAGKKGGQFPPVPEQTENASLENVVLDVEDKSNKDSTPKEPRSTASDYASVDYEKKRQSRLLKEQDSMDSSSTAGASPLPPDEPDKKESRPTTPAKHVSSNESEEEEEEEESETSSVQAKEDIEKQRKAEEEERKKEEEERRAKEEEERKAKEEEERKAKEEAEKKAKEEKKPEAPPGRRRRVRDEPAPPPVEDKPVLRRFRR